MAGHMTLDHGIGVRIPVPQQMADEPATAHLFFFDTTVPHLLLRLRGSHS